MRLFEAVTSTTPDFACVFDLEGRVQYANRSLLRVWGLSLPDVLGKTLLELGYEPWHHEMHRREIAQVAASRAPIKGEVPFKAVRTGIFGVYEYIFTPVLGDDGEVDLVAGTTRDVTDRKRAEETLHSSELRLRSVMENLSEGLMLFDAGGDLIYQNPASLRIHGFSASEHASIGREKLASTWRAWDANGRPLGFDDWPASRVFRGERFQNQVLRVVRIETGQEFHASYNGSPIHDAEGRLVLGFITIREITGQIRAEAALRRNEHRLRAFFDSELMGAIYWTVDGRITDANDKFLRLLGRDRAELARGEINWAELTPPEFRDADLRALQELRETGIDTPYEKEFIRKDGTRVPILIGAAMLDEARHEGVAFIHDITARRQAEQALRESERQFRGLAESMPQLVWTADADGRTDYVNQRWCDYTGQSPAEACDYGWAEALHPEDRARAAEAWRASLAGEAPYDIEYRLRDRHGVHRWFLSRSAPLRDPDGRVSRWFGTTTDIDDQKCTLEALRESQRLLGQARDELARANADLERKVDDRTARLRDSVAELEHFSYTITHDMRAPLRAMQAFGQILHEDYAACLDAAGRDYLRRIIGAAERMDQLITDSLNYAKAVQVELALEPVDTHALIQGIVDSYPQFQPPRTEIEIPPGLPLVLANPAGLTQCVSNLLGNAVKFVAPGKTPRVRVWAERRGAHVRLCFQDNGIGVPPEHRERIFEMFQRLGKDYEGTGVGLALVRKVATKMRGSVGLESRVGEGSCFWLELPAVPAPAEAPEE